MKNIQTQLQEYKLLENYAHINLDDIINKVTQEVGELIEADLSGDETEINKEAADVISNILSVSMELGINTELERGSGDRNNLDLSILLGKWNTKVQGLRNRYSREKVDIKEVQIVTKDLVESVLNYSNPEISLSDIIKNNTQKFDSRKDLYKPNIDLRSYIENYIDFPKTGVNFKDISMILSNPEVLRYTIMEMSEKCKDSDLIVGLDARGFIFGCLIAQNLGKPFVMLRKKGKLPGITKEIEYRLEYGKSTLEIQTGNIDKGKKVSIVDDLLATGGTVKAAIDLLESEGGIINNLSFVISLNDECLISLESRKTLENYRLDSLINYD